MRLSEYIEELSDEPNEEQRKRQLAKEKSYEITEYLDGLEDRFDSLSRGSIVGGKSPSVFVGRSNYPSVSTGILSPVGADEMADDFAVDSNWFHDGYDIDTALQFRTGLLDSRKRASVDVHDVWDGFVGTQREIAMAQGPVDIEFGVEETADMNVSLDNITSPRGPQATANSARLTENPSIPRAVKKTLEDDDWNADGAMSYLYEKGFDVYDISQILSAGTLGESENRRLVPTRWSITAVDDTVGQQLHESVISNPSVNEVQVHKIAYMGNNYWVVLAPGQWEFELVEMKSAGSVWNPVSDGVAMSSAYEGYEGRTAYVDETAGAYYAARLGALEHLVDIGRQAKCLVLREVTDDYWAPVGVWPVRETVRNAFGDQYGTAETFHSAVTQLAAEELPVSHDRLKRKSELVAGIQTDFSAFLDN